MWLLFPDFYAGPLVDVDSQVVTIWFNYIAKFAPLLDFGDLQGSYARFVFHLGPALLALPFLFHGAWRGRGPQRRMWLFLLLLSVLYVALAVQQQRWTGFAQYVIVIPYAGLLEALLDRLARGGDLLFAGARALLVLLFAFGFLFLGAALPQKPLLAGGGPACPVTEMSRWLGQTPMLADRTRRILSFINFGPELLYRTRHEVIATPNHRNGASILDAVHALGRLPPAEARGIIERRKVDLILVCLGTEEANEYRRGNNGDTLFAAIEAGLPPPWLRPIVLPRPLAESFRLLEVVRR